MDAQIENSRFFIEPRLGARPTRHGGSAVGSKYLLAIGNARNVLQYSRRCQRQRDCLRRSFLRASAFKGDSVSVDLRPPELPDLLATCSGQDQQPDCITVGPANFARSV